MKFTVRRIAAFAALLSCAALIDASDCTYTHTYLGNLPKEGNPGWHSETQGIDHDATRWYITQNSQSTFTLPLGSPIPDKCKVNTSFEYVCPNPRLWRIPVSVNLGHGVSCNDPHTAGPATTVCARFATEAPQLWSAGYDHYGDIAYYEPDASHGYICVPLEGKLRGGPQLPGAFAFFRADDLSFVASAEGPGLGTTAAWCAIDPSGVVYSSPKNAAGKTDTILRFRVDWSALALDPPEAHVEPAGSVTLQDENGAPLELGQYLQGGTFASAQLLYLLNGQGGGSCPNCGIHAFELSDAATSGPCGANAVDCVARRVAQSENGSGAFNYEFHPGWSRYEEPEGITWWDLSAPDAPPIDDTTTSGYRLDQAQLHAILLDNDSPDSDDVYVKHYKADIACSAPDASIRVDPLVVDFDDVDIGASKESSVRISNTGDTALTITSLAIVGSDSAFQIGAAPVTPFGIAAGADAVVGLRFTPVIDGLMTAELTIGSDDPVLPHVEVPLSGEGLSLEDQAAQLFDILDEGLSQRLLTGVGSGASATNRTRAFRHMLEEALTLIAEGDISEACDQLHAALIHADGEPLPGDFIAGAERASLASEIVDLRAHLGCTD